MAATKTNLTKMHVSIVRGCSYENVQRKLSYNSFIMQNLWWILAFTITCAIPSREVVEMVEKMLPRVWDLAPPSLLDFCMLWIDHRIHVTRALVVHYNTHLDKLQSSLIYPPALWINSIASTLKPTHHILWIIFNNSLQYNDIPYFLEVSLRQDLILRRCTMRWQFESG